MFIKSMKAAAAMVALLASSVAAYPMPGYVTGTSFFLFFSGGSKFRTKTER
jgi:hypothetical protein